MLKKFLEENKFEFYYFFEKWSIKIKNLLDKQNTAQILMLDEEILHSIRIFLVQINRDGVEDTRLEAKDKKMQG